MSWCIVAGGSYFKWLDLTTMNKNTVITAVWLSLWQLFPVR